MSAVSDEPCMMYEFNIILVHTKLLMGTVTHLRHLFIYSIVVIGFFNIINSVLR